MKLLGHNEGNIQLTEMQHVPATTVINTAATSVTANSNETLLLLLLILLLTLLL